MRLFTAIQIQNTLHQLVPELRGTDVAIKDDILSINGDYLKIQATTVDNQTDYKAVLQMPDENPATIISDDLTQLFTTIETMI